MIVLDTCAIIWDALEPQRLSVKADPADRIITTTAIIKGVPLVTPDEAIRNAGCVETIW